MHAGREGGHPASILPRHPWDAGLGRGERGRGAPRVGEDEVRELRGAPPEPRLQRHSRPPLSETLSERDLTLQWCFFLWWRIKPGGGAGAVHGGWARWRVQRKLHELICGWGPVAPPPAGPNPGGAFPLPGTTWSRCCQPVEDRSFALSGATCKGAGPAPAPAPRPAHGPRPPGPRRRAQRAPSLPGRAPPRRRRGGAAGAPPSGAPPRRRPRRLQREVWGSPRQPEAARGSRTTSARPTGS